MVRRITSFIFILAFAQLQPSMVMAQQCQQHKQKIDQGCADNPGLLQTVAGLSDATNGTKGEVRDTQVQATDSKNKFEMMKAECTQANQQCQQDCQREFDQAAAKQPPDVSKMQMAQRQMKECEQKEKEQNAKNDSALADLAKLLQGLAALMSAMGGGGEDPEKIAERKKEEEKDICDTPEGAILVSCQGESDPLRSRASLGGLTGVNSTGGPLGQSLARPLNGDPAAGVASESGDGAGAGGGFGGAGGGFAAAGGVGASAAALPLQDAEKGKDKDFQSGFLNADGAGGGGGGGGGFGNNANQASFQPFKFDDPLTKGSDAENGKGKGLAGKAAVGFGGKAARGVASVDPSGKGGPFQDNFLVIKKAYSEAKPSLEY